MKIRYEWSGILEIMWMEYLSLAIGFPLQFFHFKTENYVDIINIIVFIIGSIITVFYPITSHFYVYKFTKTRKQSFRQKFESLWDGNKIGKI